MTDGIKDVKGRFARPEKIGPAPGVQDQDAAPAGEDDFEFAPRSEDDAGAPRTPEQSGDELERSGAAFPLNDFGNGQRFALYFGADAMIVPRVGWFRYDGKRWKKDKDGLRVRGLAQKVSGRIIGEIPFVGLEDWQVKELAQEAKYRAQMKVLKAANKQEMTAEDEVKFNDISEKLDWIKKLKAKKSSIKADHKTFAKSSGNKAKIDAMLTEATVALAKELDELDSDPLTINTESGLLRFRVDGGAGHDFSKTASFALEPHTHETNVSNKNAPQFITKMMPVEFDPDATCPTFDAFLERVQPAADMRAFLQRWFGLSMTGLTGEQKFAFLYGGGANGKSALIDLLARMLGDYAATAKIESLTGRNRRGGGDATPDLVPLVGARMVRSAEPEEGERLKEGTIKELTGGEAIMVRSLHADFVEVYPIFKLTMSGNYKPDIRGTDDGIWRRVLLIPFDVQIPEKERDERLVQKLFEERSGILNWLVAGLVDYLEGGLQEPQAVLDATLDYRKDSDPYGTFLRECCFVSGDPSDFIYSRDLIDGFNLWLDLQGQGMFGTRTVSLKFKSMVGRYRDPRSNKPYTANKRDSRGYSGIRFNDIFARQYRDAPRNAGGHAIAAGSPMHDQNDDPRDEEPVF